MARRRKRVQVGGELEIQRGRDLYSQLDASQCSLQIRLVRRDRNFERSLARVIFGVRVVVQGLVWVGGLIRPQNIADQAEDPIVVGSVQQEAHFVRMS